MKVIGIDNWGRDYNGCKSEIVHAINLPKDYAVELAAELNEKQGEHGSTYWVVKPDTYKPFVFEGC